ncbi:MAG: hypothetical protein BMS9Abin10_1035 [Gammaproteobacteria bacterium]|nr:MAG: hypothetical protein BMS9Abin10_1035 [Gammaproteobacteria bacterium]
MTDARPRRAWKTKSGGTPRKGRPEIVACAASGEADQSCNEANCRPARRSARDRPPQGSSFEGVPDKLKDGTVDNRMDNLAAAHRLTTAPPRA